MVTIDIRQQWQNSSDRDRLQYSVNEALDKVLTITTYKYNYAATFGRILSACIVSVYLQLSPVRSGRFSMTKRNLG